MSKIREKESLECGRMHIWALKTQKLPGPLSGPWTPPQIAHFAHATLLHYVSNFRPQDLGSPLDQILDLHLLCVWLSVCPFTCISVQALISEALHIETSLLVYRYIFTISRSSLSIKVIRSRSRSYEKTYNFTYFNMLILCLLLQIINKGKVTPQGHIKVKVKISISVLILCSPYC